MDRRTQFWMYVFKKRRLPPRGTIIDWFLLGLIAASLIGSAALTVVSILM